MAKPASGTALDTSHALYASLAAAWGLLEGTGTTSADSRGTRTLTLSSSGLWATNGSGEAIIHIAAATASPLALASALTLTGSGGGGSDWSIAWRGKLSSNNDNGMVAGDNTVTTDFLWMRGANYLRFRDTGNTDADFTGVTSFTSTKDFLLTWDKANAKARLYVDGSEVNAGGIVTGTGALNITTLGNAYTSNTFALVGDLEYCYVWNGRLLTSTDAGTLHSTPYVLFSSGNSAPNTPTVSAGTPASTTCPLTGSAFSDPDVGDTHAASQWQVTTSADTGYATPIISTGDDATNKTNYTATGLTASTAYRARVRYKDSAGNYSSYAADATFTTAATGITITSPVANQWKRGGGSAVNFAVSGTYSGSPTTVEVSTNGGSSWLTLDAAPSGGTYTGTVSLAASESDYTIQVRFANSTGVTASVTGVANVRKVIAVGGQSNEAGRGTGGNQAVRTVTGAGTHRKKTASGYAVLADPTGTDGSAAGSYLVHEVNALGAALAQRLGVANFAVGGTSLQQWQKGGTGSGYYETLAAAVTAVGGCDILRMGPCETDAVNGTTQSSYHTLLAAFVASWLADFPASKVVWRTLQQIDTGSATQLHQDAINAAVLAAAGSTPGRATGDVTGVYLADVRSVPAYPGDTYHWLTDQQLGDVGGLMAVVDYVVLNPAGGGVGLPSLFFPGG